MDVAVKKERLEMTEDNEQKQNITAAGGVNFLDLPVQEFPLPTGYRWLTTSSTATLVPDNVLTSVTSATSASYNSMVESHTSGLPFHSLHAPTSLRTQYVMGTSPVPQNSLNALTSMSSSVTCSPESDVSSPSQTYHREPTKADLQEHAATYMAPIDVQEVVSEFKATLEKFGISQRFAAKYIMDDTSQGNLSFLLEKGRSKKWSELSPRGRVPYIRMKEWLDNKDQQLATLDRLKSARAYKKSGPRDPGNQREKFTLFQLTVLCRLFEENSNPSMGTRMALADKLNVHLERINVWFQNQRARGFPAKKILEQSFNDLSARHKIEAVNLTGENRGSFDQNFKLGTTSNAKVEASSSNSIYQSSVVQMTHQSDSPLINKGALAQSSTSLQILDAFKPSTTLGMDISTSLQNQTTTTTPVEDPEGKLSPCKQGDQAPKDLHVAFLNIPSPNLKRKFNTPCTVSKYQKVSNQPVCTEPLDFVKEVTVHQSSAKSETELSQSSTMSNTLQTASVPPIRTDETKELPLETDITEAGDRHLLIKSYSSKNNLEFLTAVNKPCLDNSEDSKVCLDVSTSFKQQRAEDTQKTDDTSSPSKQPGLDIDLLRVFCGGLISPTKTSSVDLSQLEIPDLD